MMERYWWNSALSLGLRERSCIVLFRFSWWASGMKNDVSRLAIHTTPNQGLVGTSWQWHIPLWWEECAYDTTSDRWLECRNRRWVSLFDYEYEQSITLEALIKYQCQFTQINQLMQHLPLLSTYVHTPTMQYKRMLSRSILLPHISFLFDCLLKFIWYAKRWMLTLWSKAGICMHWSFLVIRFVIHCYPTFIAVVVIVWFGFCNDVCKTYCHVRLMNHILMDIYIYIPFRCSYLWWYIYKACIGNMVHLIKCTKWFQKPATIHRCLISSSYPHTPTRHINNYQTCRSWIS